jgi:hypothetical protein
MRDPHFIDLYLGEVARTLLDLLARHGRPGSSFNYRLLGGLRGPDEVVDPIADLLALYDRVAVSRGILRPNLFFFLGAKTGLGARAPGPEPVASRGHRNRISSRLMKATGCFPVPDTFGRPLWTRPCGCLETGRDTTTEPL